MGRWLQIQGIEYGDDVTYLLTNAEKSSRRTQTPILPFSKDAERQCQYGDYSDSDVRSRSLADAGA